MDARRTLVVTHDVRPRRACPAPLGQVTASPGERGAPNTAGASAAPLVQHTLRLFPTGTIERGTATQHASLGEGPMSYRAFLPRRTATEREMGLLAKAARRLTTGANSAVACGGLKPFNVRWFPTDPPARLGAQLPIHSTGMKISIAVIAEAWSGILRRAWELDRACRTSVTAQAPQEESRRTSGATWRAGGTTHERRWRSRARWRRSPCRARADSGGPVSARREDRAW